MFLPIEVKASNLITRKHLKGINTLSEELHLKHRIVDSQLPSIVDRLQTEGYTMYSYGRICNGYKSTKMG
ncbi:hypothetical protein ES705_13409 [subsurface metagenome]